MSESASTTSSGTTGGTALRTLIIGGGVAGLTLAALLQRRSISPVVIERSHPSLEEGGYMLGLYYLGSRVFHGLGLFSQFLYESAPMRRYEIRDGTGRLLHAYDLEDLSRHVGPVRGITRGALIRLLKRGTADLDLRYGTTADTLEQVGETVQVRFSDGSTGTFDLVVGADGLHSSTRKEILAEDEYAFRDTGWAGWVSWADPGLAPGDTYVECWGPGRFVGLYPTKGKLGVFFGGTAEVADSRGPAGLLRDIREAVSEDAGSIVDILDSLDPDPDLFFWKFLDCRSLVWRSGRVVLLGDAATGFLPTAGLGASMAMESAAALADEVSRSGAADVERALALYERRHRPRVEAAQKASRDLGKMMFVDSPPLAWGRDQLVKHYSLERLIQSIASMMDEPI